MKSYPSDFFSCNYYHFITTTGIYRISKKNPSTVFCITFYLSTDISLLVIILQLLQTKPFANTDVLFFHLVHCPWVHILHFTQNINFMLALFCQTPHGLISLIGSVAEDYLYACSRKIYQAVNSYRSLFSNVNHKSESCEWQMRRGKLSYWLCFGKKVTRMRSITISKKHGKICDNMKTEPKIFHARINLISGKLEKKILKSRHYILPTSRKESCTTHKTSRK